MIRFRSCVLMWAAACMLAGGVAAAQPAFTVEEMLKLKRVSDPQLSPDGTRIAFVLTDVSLDQNTRNNDIYVVPVAGGAPAKFAATDRSEDRPRWSPDGKWLAFVSNRDGSSQVWVMPGGRRRSAQGHESRDRGVRRDVVARRQVACLRLGCLSRVRRHRVQREDAEGARVEQGEGEDRGRPPVPALDVMEGGQVQPPVHRARRRVTAAPRSHARCRRRSAVLAGRARRLRVLARLEGDRVREEDRQGRSHQHEQRHLHAGSHRSGRGPEPRSPRTPAPTAGRSTRPTGSTCRGGSRSGRASKRIAGSWCCSTAGRAAEPSWRRSSTGPLTPGPSRPTARASTSRSRTRPRHACSAWISPAARRGPC